jgi:hypothetical protein
MSTLSLFVSLLSIALAVAMGVILARMRREEQRRSDARVAALRDMSATDFLSESEGEPLPRADAFAPEPEPLEAFDLPEAGGLFAAPEPNTSPWRPRLAIAGAIIAVLAVIGSVAAFRGSSATAAQTAGAAPLELLSLNHQQNGQVLTVTGRVRNPRGAAAMASPTATVFLFGADGAFLTSGRALLEAPALTGGAESSFAVSIPVNGTVARYRVSFRDSANHPIAHVDRRNGAPVARTQ